MKGLYTPACIGEKSPARRPGGKLSRAAWYPNNISLGWCHDPGLKGYCARALSRAASRQDTLPRGVFQIQTFFMLKFLSDSKVCRKYYLMHFKLKMAKWLIVRIITLKRKWFWISYSNSNTFHVENFVRFKSMQKILVNAFLIKNGKMVNNLNS